MPRCCGWAAPGGWLSAEAFQHAGCGGLESQPSPAMPLLSRVPPPVWPLVDGGLTSWGPLISGRRSLRGSEAGEQACAAAWMAWGHRLPSEGAMPSHTRSCSDGAMGTLPLSAGGSPAGPPPQTLREDVAGCACPSGGRQQGPVVGRAVRLAHLLKRRGTCTVGPRRRWVLLVPASHFKTVCYGKLQVVTKIKRITDWREDAGVHRPVFM